MSQSIYHEIQAVSDALGVPGQIINGDRLIGLCPRCKEPISLHMTNGGKLSPSRTLRAEHVYSGSIKCEDAKTMEKLKTLDPLQKVYFFQDRHDDETMEGLPQGVIDDFKKKVAECRSKGPH